VKEDESGNNQSLLSCEDHGAIAVASIVTAVKEDESGNKQSLLSCEDHGAMAVASLVTAVKEDKSGNKQSLLSCEDRGFTFVKSEPYAQAVLTLSKDSSAYNALRTRLFKGKLFLKLLSLFLVSLM
jgi:hypothetical protein